MGGGCIEGWKRPPYHAALPSVSRSTRRSDQCTDKWRCYTAHVSALKQNSEEFVNSGGRTVKIMVTRCHGMLLCIKITSQTKGKFDSLFLVWFEPWAVPMVGILIFIIIFLEFVSPLKPPPRSLLTIHIPPSKDQSEAPSDFTDFLYLFGLCKVRFSGIFTYFLFMWINVNILIS